MNKRLKTALKILAIATVGLVAGLTVLFLWITRDPTTQLIDATGQKLTAGANLDEEAGSPNDSLFAEVRALIEAKKYAAARDSLLTIVEETDRDGEACVLLCDVHRELDEIDNAVDYGLKAVGLLPNSAPAHLAYAKALGAQLAADMKSIGGMLSAMGRVGNFKEVLARVIELDPEDTEARTLLVFTNLAPMPIGNIDRAIELSEEIEARDPVRGRQLLAVCYQRKKETDRAIALLRESIEKYPDERSLRVALAGIYAEDKRFEAADAEYEAARAGGEGEAYYSSLYGQARMRVRNEFEPERAIALLDEFIAAEPVGENMPSVAHACWRKGNALEQLGRKQDAEEAYEESLRHDPGLELAQKALKGLVD